MAIAASAQPRAFARLAQAWRAVVARLTDTYRPEKHYMRGPGPKCAAKAARR
jgi:hypothetical protein